MGLRASDARAPGRALGFRPVGPSGGPRGRVLDPRGGRVGNGPDRQKAGTLPGVGQPPSHDPLRAGMDLDLGHRRGSVLAGAAHRVSRRLLRDGQRFHDYGHHHVAGARQHAGEHSILALLHPVAWRAGNSDLFSCGAVQGRRCRPAVQRGKPQDFRQAASAGAFQYAANPLGDLCRVHSARRGGAQLGGPWHLRRARSLHDRAVHGRILASRREHRSLPAGGLSALCGHRVHHDLWDASGRDQLLRPSPGRAGQRAGLVGQHGNAALVGDRLRLHRHSHARPLPPVRVRLRRLGSAPRHVSREPFPGGLVGHHDRLRHQRHWGRLLPGRREAGVPYADARGRLRGLDWRGHQSAANRRAAENGRQAGAAARVRAGGSPPGDGRWRVGGHRGAAAHSRAVFRLGLSAGVRRLGDRDAVGP